VTSKNSTGTPTGEIREHPAARPDPACGGRRTLTAYKIAKQADTVMLFFLFSDEELREIFERLGYGLPPRHSPRETSRTTTSARRMARR